MKPLYFAAFFLGLVASGTCVAQGIAADQISPQGLTRDQAKDVLTVVLKHERYDPAKVGMNLESLRKKDGSDPHPGYFDFGLSYDAPEAGASQVLGAYAVSRFTGDVWELNLCKRFSNHDLKRLQKIIMERTGKSFASEKQDRSGLGCSNQ